MIRRNRLNVKNDCCGKVQIVRRTLYSEYWVNKILSKTRVIELDWKDYCLIMVQVYDEDDFGGSVLYAVKWNEKDSVTKAIDEWIDGVKDKEIDVNDFYKEDFFPEIKGSYKYINW